MINNKLFLSATIYDLRVTLLVGLLYFCFLKQDNNIMSLTLTLIIYIADLQMRVQTFRPKYTRPFNSHPFRRSWVGRFLH